MSCESNGTAFDRNTTKTIYQRTRTLATECLHTVFENALAKPLGAGWFEVLTQENEALLSGVKNIYSCNLPLLLHLLIGDSPCAKRVCALAERPEELLQVATETLNRLEGVSQEQIADIESPIFSELALRILSLIDFFPAVRDEDGVTYASKIVLRTASIQQAQSRTPAYLISDTITRQELDISPADFAACCISSDIAVGGAGDELHFATHDYNAVIDTVSKFIASKLHAAKLRAFKIRLFKILAVVLAILIAVLSATISVKITEGVAGGKPSEPTESQPATGGVATSSSNDSFFFESPTTSVSSEASSDTASDTSSVDSSTSSAGGSSASSAATSSKAITSVKKVVDANGRVTETVTIPYRYNGSNFVTYNTDIETQDAVYATISQYYVDMVDRTVLTLYINNGTDDMIRNVGIDLAIISEDNKPIVTYKAAKILEDNSSISIAANSDYFFIEYLEDQHILDPDADLGFFKFKASISYDIVKLS